MQVLDTPVSEKTSFWARAKTATVCAVANARGAAAVAGAGISSLVGQAHAAVPADVTTAISDMKTDGITVATAFLVAILAVAAIKFLRSAK